MLRAAGKASEKGRFEGGLWLTEDGGKKWERLDIPGDFDGEGPSALCGEVVGFDPANPKILFCGCETKGFFRSEDKRQEVDSESAPPVNGSQRSPVNRWVRGTANQAYLHVVTCPDAWMPLLGRGKAGPLLPPRPLPATMCRMTAGSRYNGPANGPTWAISMSTSIRLPLKSCPMRPLMASSKRSANGERTYLFPPAKNLDCFRPVHSSGLFGH